MNGFDRGECFRERAISPAGVLEHRGWYIKLYDISYSPEMQSVDLETGVALALAHLPIPAVDRHRPGLGMLIRHIGKSAQYVVLGWWDNQNELFTRTIVWEREKSEVWNDAADRFSFCVWDLQVLWHERCAYVEHILLPQYGPEIQAYLNCALKTGLMR